MDSWSCSYGILSSCPLVVNLRQITLKTKVSSLIGIYTKKFPVLWLPTLLPCSCDFEYAGGVEVQRILYVCLPILRADFVIGTYMYNVISAYLVEECRSTKIERYPFPVDPYFRFIFLTLLTTNHLWTHNLDRTFSNHLKVNCIVYMYVYII